MTLTLDTKKHKDMDEIIEMRLEDLPFVSPYTIEVFREYNIETIGQLLGVTQGFTKNVVFYLIPDGDKVLADFIDYTPSFLVDKYKTITIDKPLGYIKEKDHEDN